MNTTATAPAVAACRAAHSQRSTTRRRPLVAVVSVNPDSVCWPMESLDTYLPGWPACDHRGKRRLTSRADLSQARRCRPDTAARQASPRGRSSRHRVRSRASPADPGIGRSAVGGIGAEGHAPISASMSSGNSIPCVRPSISTRSRKADICSTFRSARDGRTDFTSPVSFDVSSTGSR